MPLNGKLRALAEAQAEYHRQRTADRVAVDPEQRARILALAVDFPTVWRDPHTPQRERKRTLALLVEDVTVLARSPRTSASAGARRPRSRGPFHPLRGHELKVIGPRHRDETLTVRDPSGVALVIPTWMLVPDAAHIQIDPQAVIGVRALRAVAALVKAHRIETTPPSNHASLPLPDAHPPSGGERETDRVRPRPRVRRRVNTDGVRSSTDGGADPADGRALWR